MSYPHLVLAVITMTVMAHANGAGDPVAGQAEAAVCAACHGQDGATGLLPTYPNLAGQNERYTLRQLEMIQSGEREIPEMAGQLTGKTPQQLANLAAYYASLPVKLGVAQGDDETVARAEQLYRGGDLDKGIAACTACHAPSGSGNASAGFPLLKGQMVEYTIAQLTEYREGRRTSDETFGGMMRDIAERLTDTEIAALADYIHGLR